MEDIKHSKEEEEEKEESSPPIKRKKVPLKKGFTLADWGTLVRSGKNISGISTKPGVITEEELKKHNKIDDIWVSLKGNVYNITAYMDYHPGGAKVLMSVAGKDATKLFDKYHSWVNYVFLLSTSYVGKLIHSIKVDESSIDPKAL